MDEYNKLLRKVQDLEMENYELKEQLRWRDAEKEPPVCEQGASILADVGFVNGTFGRHKIFPVMCMFISNTGDCTWNVPQIMSGFLKIYYWRPLDLPLGK